MYYPFFRGKQNELITLRERAELIADNNICPIIEPVKANLSSLKKTVVMLREHNAKFILIVTPQHGELKNNTLPLFDELIQKDLEGYDNFLLGYIANANSNLIDIKDFIDEYNELPIALIHYGFLKGKDLSDVLLSVSNVKKHIFIENFSGKLYQKHFTGSERILIRDGFIKRKNADHPTNEHFSDLHVTYVEEGMNGFGDFLIVGDEYMESGGPAYAVAIHLTYLDDEKDMFIRHFVSDRTNTPTDPAGKFLEALNKLKIEIESDDSPVFQSPACEEFKNLHTKAHFPGLGYVKKLSMIHHLELIADYLGPE